MKIAIIGQQDFGKAVLEAFLARGHEAGAVFTRVDPWVEALAPALASVRRVLRPG